MASSAEGSLVNNYNTTRQERDPKNRDNEILLYHNNTLVVKAERGVTLGLIKLIYSSDENNSGILLGVKPRLLDKVPCLITFDSTTLKHDAYDLIVHANESPQDIDTHEADADVRDIDKSDSESTAKAFEYDDHSENPEPDSTETPEKIQFYPEQFDFDISVKPYKCEFCPRAFYMQGHYQYHKMRHTGERPYKCDVCGKGFSYSLNLKEHKNIHTGAKPYRYRRVGSSYGTVQHFLLSILFPSCPKCDKKFAHRSTLKQHILVHGGVRPYKCHLCTKEFVQSSNYRLHLVTHKDKVDRVQKCDLCGKELLSRRWVIKHRQRCIKKLMERAEGSKTKPPKEPKTKYKCETCSKMFTYRANYETHCKKAHIPGDEGRQSNKDKTTKKNPSTRREKVSCPICHKKFLYMNCVKKHLQKRHAGVEMALPDNLQSTSNLKDSSFAITSGEDSRVIIQSTMNKNDEVTSGGGVKTSPQIEVIPIVQAVPTIHIKPSGKQSSTQSTVTFIFVPSTTKPSSSPLKSTNIEGTIPMVHSSDAIPSETSFAVTTSEASDKDKTTETGSQAITALKMLSAKVGIQEQFPCLPNRTDEQRQKVRSEHLSALEKLSKRVGDYGSVALETVTPVSRDFAQLPEQTKHQEKVDENKDGNSVCKEDQESKDSVWMDKTNPTRNA
ncbi:hypothetical protein QZH41_004438 [Actinostola sp. cb2023]|nr:hypothetical protein QZH41_004438 [Actinostola sp. cb2023]